MTEKRNVIIAIDGTFASGKGTLGKKLAAHYGFDYLDTGKLYRAVAHSAISSGVELGDEAALAALAIRLDQALLSDPILKSGDVGSAASKISVFPAVREALFDYQRAFAARDNGAILDGRDIGTIICPDANVKLYVDAKPQARAQRRFAELSGYGEDTTYDKVLAQLIERDTRDQNRAQAPLKPAADAHLLDTTDLSIDATLGAAIMLIDAVLAVKTGKADI